MSNTPSKAEIEALAAEHLKAFSQFPMGGQVWFEGEVEFARAVLAKWGAPQQEAQEPAAYVEVSQSDAEVSMTWGPEPAGFNLPTGRYALYTAPQPAPAPPSDDVVKDAMRYRWLRNKSTVLHGTAWLGSATAYQRDVGFLRRDDALVALDAAIDAALAAQGGKDA